MQDTYNFVFYNPFKKIGGVSILFIRLAKLLLKKGHNVIFVDMKEGYMVKNRIKGVKFINYNEPHKIPKKSILFLQSTPYWRIKKLNQFADEMKVIFYNLHPNNLNFNLVSTHSRYFFLVPFKKILNTLSFLKKKKLSKFLDFLYKKKGIIFEDEFNFYNTNKLYNLKKTEASYLPIFIENNGDKFLNRKKIHPSKMLKFVWLGRLDDFKISIIKKIFYSLNEFTNYSFEFSLIGDGNYLSHLKEFSKQFYFKTYFLGEVDNITLKKTLKNYDVCFAMYTSALESSKLGIPTICVDYSYFNIKNYYRFELIYDKKNFTLSKEISDLDILRKNNLPNLLKFIINNYNYVSKSCYNYWLEKHSDKSIYDLIIKYSQECNLTASDLKYFYIRNNVDFFTKLINIVKKNQSNGHGFLF